MHTTAGYALYAAHTIQTTFDLQPNDIFACVADCGWITGHTYVVYGPLLSGGRRLREKYICDVILVFTIYIGFVSIMTAHDLPGLPLPECLISLWLPDVFSFMITTDP